MDANWDCERCTLINTCSRQTCETCGANKPRQDTRSPHVSRHLQTNHGQIGGQFGWQHSLCPTNERRIVFLGRTGAGKSATGNNILGTMAFESSSCGSSVTRKCQRGRALRFGCDVHIIDTPGLFDTQMTQGEITKEIVKCVAMTAPGPHAFVVVVRIDRFTQEEQATVQHFKDVFGEGMLNHMIVLFTRKDDLIHDNKSLQEFLMNVPTELRELLQSCNNKSIAFNNRGSEAERDQDVKNFLSLVDRVFMDNGGRCYTSDMYDAAERTMQEREQALRREHERMIEQERETIQRKYESLLQKSEAEKREKTEKLEKTILELNQRADDAKRLEEAQRLEVAQRLEEQQDLASLRTEVEELKKAIESMNDDKIMEDKQKELAKLDEDEDFREEAREEVNEEKPGVLQTLMNAIPHVLEVVVPIAMKIILRI